MIRRHAGSEWWLITQHHHALLAGELARHLGGAVRPLSPEAVAAVGQHDCGWPAVHDEQPTLNDAGQPADVFETPLELGLRIWRESSARAFAALGPYGGLLVSLHSLSLSAHAAARTLNPRPTAPADLKAQFEVNKFQHAEVELQENCRRAVGLRTDHPLTLGLAEDSLDPAEQQLAYDFRWLQGMDQLSLDLCCTRPPFPSIAHVPSSPGAGAMHLTVTRTGPASACVNPWPFASPRLAMAVPFRRVPDRPIPSVEHLRRLYASTREETATLTLEPPGPLAAIA